jgi:hypothetical protein
LHLPNIFFLLKKMCGNFDMFLFYPVWDIRDTILLQECAHASWTCVCKEGRNSLVTQVLLGTCHMQTWEQKGIQSYELACTHKKRSEISGETRFFGLVARPVRWVFHGCQGHSGLGRACNMKVCVVVSQSRLWEHILLFKSYPARCPSCPSSPPSFLHTNISVRGR